MPVLIVTRGIEDPSSLDIFIIFRIVGSCASNFWVNSVDIGARSGTGYGCGCPHPGWRLSQGDTPGRHPSALK
jgi:hypothetical protein